MRLPPVKLVSLLCALAAFAAACTGSGSDVSSDTTALIESVESTDTTDSAEGTEDGSTETTERSTPDGSEPIDPEPEPIVWTECGRIECATVSVPADYTNPDAGMVDISVNVVRASDQANRIGYLFINPGGPGESGVEFATAAKAFFPTEITDVFDVVGFDPRGVGESGPEFACGEQGQLLGEFNKVDAPVDTSEEIAVVEGAIQLCADSMGPAAGRIHSEFVARDMDQIRKAMGEDQISYIGFSYGSTLGLWYASIFPNSVRAMVVDGADNPLDDVSTQEARLEASTEQFKEFERLLGNALEACDSADCPIFNGGDPIGYYYDAAEKFPLVIADTEDIPDAAIFGVVSTLYSESTWPDLYDGLFQLNENDDATVLSTYARIQVPEGGLNATEYINCLDSYSLFPEIDRAIQLEDGAVLEDMAPELFPLLDAASGDGVGLCPFMDSLAPVPFAGRLNGGGVPILVVGNPSDPATPYTESVEVATETMDNAYLVEADHASHVVYPKNNCVNDLVHSLLIDLELPADRKSVCERQEPTAEDSRAELVQLCQFIVPDIMVGASDAEIEEVCETFASRVVSELGPEALEAANRGDEDAGQQIGLILGAVIGEALG